ncbi:DUF481 domain-containing protein [Photobacterium phosphoreum]|uniref:DUF481 domain-containing protein n=1 Tax=Photobacterium phosphoreum TaxID=659 RepID=UPI000D16A0F9|nr:DUF481 domain-containing protein [Photobacterium phosphoreum]PSU67844.1 DUF481 domain-containing protein [Photobacterium phosphoreum]PTB31737.1 DUF481 domain-containing protein [Photobacterium phosphoreum]
MARYILTLLLLATTAANASEESIPEAPSEPSPLTSTIGLGYQALSGNSDSQTMNGNVALTYTKGRYQTNADAKFIMAKKNGQEDKRKLSTSLKSKRMIRDGYYFYGNGSYIDDRYGPYYADSIVSTGIGYRLFSYETFQTLVDIGPGFRHQDPNLDEIKSDSIVKQEVVNEMVLQSTIDMQWKPLKSLTLSAKFNVISGKSNTTLESSFNATNAITDNIALNLGYTQTYYSWVPEGMKNSDTTTTISLIYTI